MHDEEKDKVWNPLERQGYLEGESREDQIHRNTLLLKIDTIRKIISETSFSNDKFVHLKALDQFINLIENGQQPRKRSLTILNKWWRLYNNI